MNVAKSIVRQLTLYAVCFFWVWLVHRTWAQIPFPRHLYIFVILGATFVFQSFACFILAACLLDWEE